MHFILDETTNTSQRNYASSLWMEKFLIIEKLPTQAPTNRGSPDSETPNATDYFPILRKFLGRKTVPNYDLWISRSTPGGTIDHAQTPLDGVNVWNTISKGESSPRKEILLNIDLKHKQESDELSAITYYEGIAFRSGEMKLLMTVPNSSWYKPPELEGNPDHKQYIDWSEGGMKVRVNDMQLFPEGELNNGGGNMRRREASK